MTKKLDDMSLEEYLDWCRDGAPGAVPYPYEDLTDNGEREEDARRNQETYPKGCELCGEKAGAEMGEFYDPSRDDGQGDFPGHVLAHAQCGLDRGLEMA